jgi:hypothetical protein
MSLILQSSGGGQITIQEPTTASNFTQDLPAASGTVVITGTTPTLNGITFPATAVPSADANTLDDYEEGTWTPAYGGGANITGTPTFSQAVYTKVGRLVTLSFKSSVNATTGNADTYIVVSGVPFTFANPMALYSTSNTNVRVGTGQVYSSSNLFIQYPAQSGLPSGSDDWYSTLIYYV